MALTSKEKHSIALYVGFGMVILPWFAVSVTAGLVAMSVVIGTTVCINASMNLTAISQVELMEAAAEAAEKGEGFDLSKLELGQDSAQVN
jgi:hypothetical protein